MPAEIRGRVATWGLSVRLWSLTRNWEALRENCGTVVHLCRCQMNGIVIDSSFFSLRDSCAWGGMEKNA